MQRKFWRRGAERRAAGCRKAWEESCRRQTSEHAITSAGINSQQLGLNTQDLYKTKPGEILALMDSSPSGPIPRGGAIGSWWLLREGSHSICQRDLCNPDELPSLSKCISWNPMSSKSNILWKTDPMEPFSLADSQIPIFFCLFIHSLIWVVGERWWVKWAFCVDQKFFWSYMLCLKSGLLDRGELKIAFLYILQF